MNPAQVLQLRGDLAPDCFDVGTIGSAHRDVRPTTTHPRAALPTAGIEQASADAIHRDEGSRRRSADDARHRTNDFDDRAQRPPDGINKSPDWADSTTGDGSEIHRRLATHTQPTVEYDGGCSFLRASEYALARAYTNPAMTLS